jgi:hypothetical protein
MSVASRSDQACPHLAKRVAAKPMERLGKLWKD